MGDYDLDSFSDLAGVPGFALEGIHTRAQNCRVASFVASNSQKPRGDVVLLRVHRAHVASASFGKFTFDLLDQFSFFRIELFFRKIARLCNDESDIVLDVWIELRAVQRS